MHLIILAVVAFGLTENLNYDFNLSSGGECVYPTGRPLSTRLIDCEPSFFLSYFATKVSSAFASVSEGRGPLVSFLTKFLGSGVRERESDSFKACRPEKCKIYRFYETL